MAVFYVEALRADRPEGPAIISPAGPLGAVIAWEMTRLLQRDGHAARLTLIEPPLAAADGASPPPRSPRMPRFFARAGAPGGNNAAGASGRAHHGQGPRPLLQHLHAEGTSQGLAFASLSSTSCARASGLLRPPARRAPYVPESFPSSPARLLRAKEAADATGEGASGAWGARGGGTQVRHDAGRRALAPARRATRRGARLAPLRGSPSCASPERSPPAPSRPAGSPCHARETCRCPSRSSAWRIPRSASAG